MTEKLLSVITANYNNEPYIRDCLDSVLNQTYKNIEIIVCDDCSTDSSPAITREYENKFPGIVKSLFSPKNRGVAQNRHEAILRADGEYITTLDSDDYYIDPQKLEKEMELISRYKEKTGKDIIAFSNIMIVDAKGLPKGALGNRENIKEGRILDDIMGRSCMIPRDFIMTRDAYFDAGGYDSRIPIYEDWDLKIRLAQKYEFHYTGINGTAYRRHGKGLSAAPAPTHIEWLNIVFKKNIRLEPDIALQEKITRQFEEFILRLERNKN